MRLIGLLAIVWPIVGAVAGALNYLGASPKVTNCHVPQLS